MATYRRKLADIKAFQMTKAHRENKGKWPNWLQEACRREPGKVGAIWPDDDECAYGDRYSANRLWQMLLRYRWPSPKLLCETLEGTLKISLDDWIIQGIAGEVYPCKPDLFDRLYELVEETHE